MEAAGARYPLVVDPFIQLAKLTASDGAGGDHFGTAVAVSGDTVVVGAVHDNTSQGSAYVFVKPGGGWATGTETAKLTASDGVAGDQFGIAVAISGATIVVGADHANIGINGDQGAAYVFGPLARTLKQNALTTLQGLFPTVNFLLAVFVKPATFALTLSLNSYFWVDESHLKPGAGGAVFSYEQLTALPLQLIPSPPRR